MTNSVDYYSFFGMQLCLENPEGLNISPKSFHIRACSILQQASLRSLDFSGLESSNCGASMYGSKVRKVLVGGRMLAFRALSGALISSLANTHAVF